jgi:hypothetical protein
MVDLPEPLRKKSTGTPFRILCIPQNLYIFRAGNRFHLSNQSPLHSDCPTRYIIFDSGTAKNPNAPLLYKTAVSALSVQEKPDRIDFILQHFLQIMREIPSLPAAPLAEHVLKFMDNAPSDTILEMVRSILTEGRMREVEKDDLEEALLKIIFSDVLDRILR